MINTLHIKNIGIIDDLFLEFGEGFNVITGETGAGKTLIIDALGVLAGGRFSKEIIRNGENYSLVEASFYIPNKGYEEDTVVVTREINLKGKNICKINGRLVTVNELKEFMKKIIDIHGQNNNQNLLNVGMHIEFLDTYIGKDILSLKRDYYRKYKEYLKIKDELSNNYGDEREKQRKLDLLNYQKNEIEEASLKEGEEEELEEKRSIFMSSEKINIGLCEAEERLNDSTIYNIGYSIKSLEKIEKYNSEYSDVVSRIRDCYYELQEAANDIANLKSDMNFDEEEQNNVEERLNLIKTLKRKYGNNVKEILNYKKEVEDEIEKIENLEVYINSLKNKLNELENKMYALSVRMNDVRVKYSKELSGKINKELKDLEMKNASFNINVDFVENTEETKGVGSTVTIEERKFTKYGLNRVEFKISTNIGEEEKSLTKIASGGEMSRVMLAIKSVLTDSYDVPVVIFDEIDTGISGIAANATGDKMKKISKNHQVICVTHLASITAKGDNNYFVSKKVKDGKTNTHIKKLSEEELLQEIARISSGTVTQISINHAKELRKMCIKNIA